MYQIRVVCFQKPSQDKTSGLGKFTIQFNQKLRNSTNLTQTLSEYRGIDFTFQFTLWDQHCSAVPKQVKDIRIKEKEKTTLQISISHKVDHRIKHQSQHKKFLEKNPKNLDKKSFDT